MCGIAGVFEYSASESKINNKMLKTMSDSIAHRGPDSDGQWISPENKCGLAFRRLAIVDLRPEANQPMITADKKFAIVFNGEIYNHLEIRQELLKRGYHYNSNGDTESILFGYREWGEDIVNKLSGMFAFAIWDEDKKELFCARDRVGKKPLYYYHRDGRFVFSSEIKAILKHPDISKEFNENELSAYLNWCMTSSRGSLFKNICKLPASHCLKINNKGEINIYRYWSPFDGNTGYNDLTEKETTGEILRLLRVAIKDRMMSDVPFGVFLSGGIDSSLNVALMAELMDRPIDTYTVGFKELEKYNELKYARQISDLYKTNHHEILIDDKDAFPILQDLTWYEDEPNGDPVCIPLYFLSKLTRDSGTIVIQVGEGSDELFVGYPWMRREYNFYQTYWKVFKSLPQSARKAFYYSVKPLMQLSGMLHPLDYIKRGAFDYEHYWSGMPIFTTSHQEMLLNKNYHYLMSNSVDYISSIHQEALRLKPDMDYLQRIFFVELYQRLSEILLMRVDKIGMANSIEARVPFLDYRLIEFVMSIPPGMKIPEKHTTKYLLKKAVTGILPDNIIHRKKQGFWAPVNEWLRNQWYDYAYNNVMNSKIFNMPVERAGSRKHEAGNALIPTTLFNMNYVKALFENHKSGKQQNGLKIFQLLELSLWHERFFE